MRQDTSHYALKNKNLPAKIEKPPLQFGSVAGAMLKIKGLVDTTQQIAQYAPRPGDKNNARRLVSELSGIMDLLSNPVTANSTLLSINQNLAKGLKFKDISSQSIITQMIANYFPINSDNFGLNTNPNLGGIKKGGEGGVFELPEFNPEYLNNLLLILAHLENAKENDDGTYSLANIAHTRGQDNPETIRKHSYTVIEATDKEIALVESFVSGNTMYIIDMRKLKAVIATADLSAEQIRQDILNNSKTDLDNAPYSTRVEHRAGYEGGVIELIDELLAQRRRDLEVLEMNETKSDEVEIGENQDQLALSIHPDHQVSLDRLKNGSVVEVVGEKKDTQKRRNYRQTIDALTSYVRDNGRIPIRKSRDNYEVGLANAFSNLKSGGKFTAEDKVTLESVGYPIERQYKTYAQTISMLLDHVKSNGDLPSTGSEDERVVRLARSFKGLKDGSIFVDELTKKDKLSLEAVGYSFEKQKEIFDITIEPHLNFVNENGRLPRVNSDDKEESRLATLFDKFKNNDSYDILTAKDKLSLEAVGYSFEKSYKTYEETISSLLNFVDRTGQLPRVNSYDKEESSLVSSFKNLKINRIYKGKLSDEDRQRLREAGYNI